VALCTALSLDGKLIAARESPFWRGTEEQRRAHPWAAWYEDPAALLLADPNVVEGLLPAGFPAHRFWQTAGSAGLPDPNGAWRELRRQHVGVRRVVCLGGAVLFRQLLDAGVVRELLLAALPLVAGRGNAPTLSGPVGTPFFAHSLAWRLARSDTRDGECLLHYRSSTRPAPAQSAES
jgi:riboflavin biosynthesis pyrimidine reductase